MNYITTTQLRTDTPNLVQALLNGNSVDLIHKSKVLGTIVPAKYEGREFTKKDALAIMNASQKLNLPILTNEEREKIYQKHLMEKYGKNIH